MPVGVKQILLKKFLSLFVVGDLSNTQLSDKLRYILSATPMSGACQATNHVDAVSATGKYQAVPSSETCIRCEYTVGYRYVITYADWSCMAHNRALSERSAHDVCMCAFLEPVVLKLPYESDEHEHARVVCSMVVYRYRQYPVFSPHALVRMHALKALACRYWRAAS